MKSFTVLEMMKTGTFVQRSLSMWMLLDLCYLRKANYLQIICVCRIPIFNNIVYTEPIVSDLIWTSEVNKEHSAAYSVPLHTAFSFA